MYTKEELFAQAAKVIDPELDFNLVELGLIYDIKQINEEEIKVVMTLSTKACPLHQLILSWVEEALLKLQGIKKVEIELVWEPAWDISMASDEVRAKLAGF